MTHDRRRSGPDNVTGTADDQTLTGLLGAEHLPDVRPEHRAHRAGDRQQPLSRDGRDAQQAVREQLLVPGRRSTPTIATCATTRRAIRTRRCTARGTATPATTTACRTSSSRAVVELRGAPERHLPAAVGHHVLRRRSRRRAATTSSAKCRFATRNNTQRRDPHRSAGRPLRVDEDLGQPHHQAVQDVGQPVDRRRRSTCSTR